MGQQPYAVRTVNSAGSKRVTFVPGQLFAVTGVLVVARISYLDLRNPPGSPGRT
jgi:hypothetical protein